jgi:hypothetical protein
LTDIVVCACGLDTLLLRVLVAGDDGGGRRAAVGRCRGPRDCLLKIQMRMRRHELLMRVDAFIGGPVALVLLACDSQWPPRGPKIRGGGAVTLFA